MRLAGVRRFAVFFVAAIVVSAGAPAAARKSSLPSTGLRGIEFGRPAPDFAYDDGNGSGTRRLSDFAGHAVIVHFWASWCKPCNEEMPLFARLRDKYGAKVDVLTLAWHESTESARNFATLQGWGLPVAAMVGADPERVYGVQEVPTTLILGPDRSVSYVSVGEASWDELDTALSKASAPVAPSSIDPSARL